MRAFRLPRANVEEEKKEKACVRVKLPRDRQVHVTAAALVLVVVEGVPPPPHSPLSKAKNCVGT